MNTNKKLKVKDIITVTLLALINVVIFFASSLLYVTPFTILLMPVLFSLLEGMVFLSSVQRYESPEQCSFMLLSGEFWEGICRMYCCFFYRELLRKLSCTKRGTEMRRV